MTIDIDRKKALDLLEKAVNIKGDDYMYGSEECLYSRNGQPSCIVGYALNEAGAPIDTLEAIDHDLSETGIDEPNVLYVLAERGIFVDEDAVSVFAAAQRAQDSNYSWGYAFAQALNAR